MTVIPLFDASAAPDAPRHVTAPGGYEWWCFDAEDPANGIRVVFAFCDGFCFHPDYVRRYAAFRRRPTHCAPPQAWEYPCVYLLVYQRGRIVGHFLRRYPSGSLIATADEIRIGENQITRDPSGAVHVVLGGVSTFGWQQGNAWLSADLTWRRRFPTPVLEHAIFANQVCSAEHRLILSDPLCHVAGAIHLRRRGMDDVEIRIDGRGFREHLFGTGLIGTNIRRWLRGRVLMDDGALLFHIEQPCGTLPGEVHVFEASSDRLIEWKPSTVAAVLGGATPQGLRFPRQIILGPQVSLDRGRVIDSSPFHLCVMYEALWKEQRGHALCEMICPQRLRWPIVGRMIRRAIDQQFRQEEIVIESP